MKPSEIHEEVGKLSKLPAGTVIAILVGLVVLLGGWTFLGAYITKKGEDAASGDPPSGSTPATSPVAKVPFTIMYKLAEDTERADVTVHIEGRQVGQFHLGGNLRVGKIATSVVRVGSHEYSLIGHESRFSEDEAGKREETSDEVDLKGRGEIEVEAEKVFRVVDTIDTTQPGGAKWGYALKDAATWVPEAD